LRVGSSATNASDLPGHWEPIDAASPPAEWGKLLHPSVSHSNKDDRQATYSAASGHRLLAWPRDIAEREPRLLARLPPENHLRFRPDHAARLDDIRPGLHHLC